MHFISINLQNVIYNYRRTLDRRMAEENLVPEVSVERERNVRHGLCTLLFNVMREELTNRIVRNDELNGWPRTLQKPLTYRLYAYLMGEAGNSNIMKMSRLSSRYKGYRHIHDNFHHKEDLGSICYLKCMIATADKFSMIHKEKLLEDFVLLIEQIAIHNEMVLYDIIKILCDLKMHSEIQDVFIQGLTDYIHVNCNKQYSGLSNLLLDINMTCKKGSFLQKLTINMRQHLHFAKENTVNNVEKIIYRSFCKVRHEDKVNNNIDPKIEKYKKYFSFIPTIEAEEEMEKLSHFRSFLIMLILFINSSCSKHKSAQLKKYLWLKYEYEDAILYLLWCSGDVEINPGPTLKKLEKKPDSVKKRNWIHDMCTTALKLSSNIALTSKSDGMWKEKPDNWQELHGDKPFYDPRNKPKSKKFTIEDDKKLLDCLLKCCDGKNIPLPSNFQMEITASKGDAVNTKLLLELYVTRQEIEAIKMAKDLLIMHRSTPDLQQTLKFGNVDLSFNPKSIQEENSKEYSDVLRDLAITFCKISKDLPILEKSDGIWKTQPCDWNPNHLYYSPCNTVKRYDKHQDQQSVDNLLSYCEKKSKSIPPELQLVVNAWKLKVKCKLGKSREICKQEKSHKICNLEKIREICKHYTIWSSMAIIQHSIKYLEIEGLLEKLHVQQSLKQIGVSLHCEKGPKHLHSKSTVTTDNEGKVSGLSYNSISDNLRDIHSSSPSSSASDSDIVCCQHPYEEKALTNSQTIKSVIKCSKPDFQNHPSTSGCTIYSTLVPCPDSRGYLQSTDERLEFSDSHTFLSEILYEGTDFQSSTSSCTTYSKRAPCQENSVDLQPRDGRDLSDSHKSLPQIICQKPDFQPSSSGCSSFIKRPECLNVRENVPSTERIQKRRRPSSEERWDKRPRLHSGNESQASTSPITRCYGDTTPSSYCDSEIADQCVNSIGNMEDSSDQSSNRITLPDNIQDTDSSKNQLFGLEDEIVQHLEEIVDRYINKSCDNQEERLKKKLEENLEENLGEDLEHIDRLLKSWETL